MVSTAGRLHLARFDKQAPSRCQSRILLGLLHQARSTRFGREHDFRRIRDVADFRRLVPLTTRAELWRDYWQPLHPHLDGGTWPTLPSAAWQAAHRRALRTALALVGHARPRARLLSGALLWAGDEAPSDLALRGGLAPRIPALVRPYVHLASERTPEPCAGLPVTCLVGSVERLVPLVEAVAQASGKKCLSDVWPGLTAVLYTRRSPSVSVERLREAAGGALLLETAGRAEGPIAVEDPRYGLQRLLFDHGVFFEFAPPGRAGELRCPRYGIDEVELGLPYELVLTSPAGLWACRVGRTVCLERRDPPLLRFVDTDGITLERKKATQEEPASRPQSAGSRAVPPESSSHIPWSTLVDRG